MSQEEDNAAKRQEAKRRERREHYERNRNDPEFRRRRAEIEREWRERNPERREEIKRRHIAKSYGLTLEEYDAILARGCAVCGSHGGRMCLDHDHDSEQVRDALCHNCNSGLGLFGDDPKRLRAAAKYLEQHNS